MGAALELVQFHCCSCLLHSVDLSNMNALVVLVVSNLEEDCSQSIIICINKYNYTFFLQMHTTFSRLSPTVTARPDPWPISK